jgi:Family of unknown function (DUF5335)
MPMTTRVPGERLMEYFNRFTQRFLQDGSPEAADVEIVEPDWGDQFVAQSVRLRGVTYDPHVNALEFALDLGEKRWGDHRVYDPSEVWTLEEEDGFLSAIEVVHGDSSREIVSVKRVGLRRLA